MSLQVKINKKIIGENQPVYIIAEAGSNHNTNFGTALELIDTAVAAHADAVKFQLFKAEKLYPKNAGIAKYLAKDYKNIHDLIRSMEMPVEWLPKLVAYCKKKNIEFLCSPFDEESADALDTVGVAAFKIASSECNHTKLIEHVAKKGKPIILSTGISSLGEIEEAVNIIRKYHDKIIIMHCIVSYPAEIKDTNLRYVQYLKDVFRCPSGLSDHSLDPLVLPIAMTAIGGKIIEKHFTLDKKSAGPDHKFAIEPGELTAMVTTIRLTEATLAPRQNKILESEQELVEVSKRAIQTTKNIKKGETLNTSNIAILRPGKNLKGIAPRFYDGIVGKKVNKNIEEGSGVRWDDLLN